MKADGELGEALRSGSAALGLTLPPAAVAALIAYLHLLQKWNRAYNLTAVRELREMVARHLLDSLAVLPHLHGSSCVDVGSGAGLPGVPLALAGPERRLVLLEANGKRARFLETVRQELGLGNVDIVESRAEDYRPGRGFDTVISRAVGGVPELLRIAGHLCAPDGRLMLMQAGVRRAGLDALPDGWSLAGVRRLDVPGLDAERNLVMLRPDRMGS